MALRAIRYRMIEMKAIKRVPLGEIDLSDETFSVNFMPDLERLRSSIMELGLIQPVLLREKSDGYQVICGFRRISIFREFKNPDIEARVFSEKEGDDFSLFSLSLHENLTTRGLNTVEKAIVLKRLVHDFNVNRTVVIKTYLPLLSLETHEKILNTFLSLVRMEDEIKKYILKEEVSRSNIRILSTFTSKDRTAILRLISPLKMSENRLREVMTLLEEISRRERCAVQEVVDRREIEAILSEKETSPSQKTERVKKVLMDYRYPRMSRIEERFERKKRELNLPPNVSLHHPPFFEGRGLKIEFQFETMDEYRSVISSLSLLDKTELEEMLQEEHPRS